YTGLRFSDLSQITPDKITNNGTRLKIKTLKTGETVVIPLHPAIKAILKKYDNQLPRVISNQKFNDYLKDLGEQAELKENVNIAITKRGLQVDTTYNKFDLITVHTARRSFATNMYLAGVPSISIMKITGHRTEKAFMKYIKISQDQNADLIAKHPYFKKAPLKIAK
ncbi:MAG TPA: site-specific integrase, partial [Bacteroidales bacterium]|nr:site-specific integrase [Bacteroidales bacterium]